MLSDGRSFLTGLLGLCSSAWVFWNFITMCLSFLSCSAFSVSFQFENSCLSWALGGFHLLSDYGYVFHSAPLLLPETPLRQERSLRDCPVGLISPFWFSFVFLFLPGRFFWLFLLTFYGMFGFSRHIGYLQVCVVSFCFIVFFPQPHAPVFRWPPHYSQD